MHSLCKVYIFNEDALITIELYAIFIFMHILHNFILVHLIQTFYIKLFLLKFYYLKIAVIVNINSENIFLLLQMM